MLFGGLGSCFCLKPKDKRKSNNYLKRIDKLMNNSFVLDSLTAKVDQHTQLHSCRFEIREELSLENLVECCNSFEFKNDLTFDDQI